VKAELQRSAWETMMASFNRVILLGNLTRDPQVKYLPSGTAVAELGLAVNRTWFDKQTQQRREEVTFVDVTLWGRQAEVAGEYLAKGRQVLIEGRLHLDTWQDKESGQNRSKLKVVCENMTMVGSRSDGGGGGGGGAPRRAAAPAQQESSPDESFYDTPAHEMPDDEVPF
jgi:single-strand DNA-binding protein